jgi:hypothetical protein
VTVKKVAVETTENCGNCKYFKKGRCVKTVPAVLLDKRGKVISMWPPVDANAWCGDWKS